MRSVVMMVETAVDTIPTLISALIVNAMSMRLVLLVHILLLVTVFVMMRLTMKIATMMVETVALCPEGAENITLGSQVSDLYF